MTRALKGTLEEAAREREIADRIKAVESTLGDYRDLLQDALSALAAAGLDQPLQSDIRAALARTASLEDTP